VDESSMLRAGVLLALATGLAAALAGVQPWLALAVVAVWIGSLWMARPAPNFEHRGERSFTVARETIAPFIEPLGVPLLLLDAERIVAANKAAREALGSHVSGQDARIALRHPEAVSLLTDPGRQTVLITGLTTPRSLWQLSRFNVDERYRLIEFINRTAEADISRAHTDFVANASHELRTPLASIVGFIETLRDPETEVDAATRSRFLTTMEGEARRMQSLVEDLMSLSRIEAEKHSIPEERLDLAALARAIGKDVAAIRGEGRIVIEAGKEPALIAGDHVQIDQLVRNLVDNGLKYGDPDQPVTIRIAAEPEWLVLTVVDRGPGIAPEHLPHLTRRFYRTDPGRSRASGGTGLGLAIVKHIVERHRGTLDFASQLGEGTRVTVRFPSWKGLSQ
jgi:two-component system phosphate regulon sensor histidine kinase PhoR